MKVLVSGAHGLMGSALVTKLRENGHTAVRLVRGGSSGGGRGGGSSGGKTEPEGTEGTDITWNPAVGNLNADELEGFDAAVHLGGVSIGEKRWTASLKQRLWDSRIRSTDLLAETLTQTVARPQVFVCASAIGYYGDRGDEALTETSSVGTGFLADLCVAWEAACEPARRAGIRVVNLRSGVVLSPDGGALARQIPLFKLFAGGRLGTGRQWTSWITLKDEVAAIIHALEHADVAGPVNLVAPNPVTNADYTATLAGVLNRPAIVPSPRKLISLALGSQLTDEVLLASQRVAPKVLQRTGFRFAHPELEPALRMLLGKELGKGE